MKLTTAHQVLIVGAIALGAVFALRAVWLFAHGGAAIELVLGAGGAALALALAWYLRRFRSKLRREGAPHAGAAEEAR